MTTTSRDIVLDHTLDREFVADHTVDRAQRPIVEGPNKFKLAIFGANVSTGQGGLTQADNTIKLGNWGEIQGLAQKADRYGIEGFTRSLAGRDSPAPSGPGDGSSRRSPGLRVSRPPRRTSRFSPPATSRSSTR